VGHSWRRVGFRRGWLCALTMMLAACATRTVPPLPTAPAYPEFVVPVVPESLQGEPGAERVERGWRYLQNGDLGSAEDEFAQAVARSPGLYPAVTGMGYAALARRDYGQSAERFDEALRNEPRYVPALVGRGQALLADGRSGEALDAFERALVVDATLVDVGRRVQVLRLRHVQEVIAEARAAAESGRSEDARAAYAQALVLSPDSPFLYRELGVLEQGAGEAEAALTHFRRAVELDTSDAQSFVHIGEILEQRAEYDAAEAAYQRAAAIEPGADIASRIAAVRERAREARLPAEFRAIPSSTALTRGELAALVGVRLEALIRTAPTRQVVMTDADSHWAAPWIRQVAEAGLIPEFENHTFQPGAVVRRADLAAVVRQILAVMARARPELAVWLNERPVIADMAVGHLSYPAVATAVASRVLPLEGDGRFQANRVVTGAEAVDALSRLRVLLSPTR